MQNLIKPVNNFVFKGENLAKEVLNICSLDGQLYNSLFCLLYLLLTFIQTA